MDFLKEENKLLKGKAIELVKQVSALEAEVLLLRNGDAMKQRENKEVQTDDLDFELLPKQFKPSSNDAGVQITEERNFESPSQSLRFSLFEASNGPVSENDEQEKQESTNGQGILMSEAFVQPPEPPSRVQSGFFNVHADMPAESQKSSVEQTGQSIEPPKFEFSVAEPVINPQPPKLYFAESGQQTFAQSAEPAIAQFQANQTKEQSTNEKEATVESLSPLIIETREDDARPTEQAEETALGKKKTLSIVTDVDVYADGSQVPLEGQALELVDISDDRSPDEENEEVYDEEDEESEPQESFEEQDNTPSYQQPYDEQQEEEEVIYEAEEQEEYNYPDYRPPGPMPYGDVSGTFYQPRPYGYYTQFEQFDPQDGAL